MREEDMETTPEFPGAQYNMYGNVLVPTKETMESAAKALANDSTSEEVKGAASRILNAYQDVQKNHPELLN